MITYSVKTKNKKTLKVFNALNSYLFEQSEMELKGVKETDIKKELYSFIVTTINIYAMLIMIAIILAVFITSKITEPLSLIKDKLKSIKIGSENEKIEWKQQD